MNDTITSHRILAIDYGLRRIGISISDPLRILAQPMPTIDNRGIENILKQIEKLISEKNITEIIVGMPYQLKGGKGTTANKVDLFIEKLKQKFKIKIHSWDERLSSVAAERFLHQLGKSPSRNKKRVDQISAQLILQSYLDYLSVKKKQR